MNCAADAGPVDGTQVPDNSCVAANRAAAATAALDLLARTVEPPGSKRELLTVLTEYRQALRVLVAANAGPASAR